MKALLGASGLITSDVSELSGELAISAASLAELTFSALSISSRSMTPWR
jgi:hypothetical protein